MELAGDENLTATEAGGQSDVATTNAEGRQMLSCGIKEEHSHLWII